MKAPLFLLVCLVFVNLASAETILSVNLEVYENDSVFDRGIRLEQNNPTDSFFPGDYRLWIADSDNLTLFEENMSIDFVIFSDPPTLVDKTLLEVRVPYNTRMNHLSFYRGEKEIFSAKIEVCNNDSFCDISKESYFSCPSDCPLDEEDGLCYNVRPDVICDPDCLKGLDPDCDREQADLGEEDSFAGKDQPPNYFLLTGVFLLVLLMAFFTYKKIRGSSQVLANQ